MQHEHELGFSAPHSRPGAPPGVTCHIINSGVSQQSERFRLGLVGLELLTMAQAAGGCLYGKHIFRFVRQLPGMAEERKSETIVGTTG
jgi:hypothetical protein